MRVEVPRRPHPSPRLRTCIACGARKMVRKKVAIERRNGRGVETVVADVCTVCGERYFDLQAMRTLETRGI